MLITNISYTDITYAEVQWKNHIQDLIHFFKHFLIVFKTWIQFFITLTITPKYYVVSSTPDDILVRSPTKGT